MYRSYRKKRRLNPRKFITFLLFVGVFITIIVLAINGKSPPVPGNLKVQGTANPTNTSTVSPTNVPRQVVQPTPWPTPEPMPEDSTDRSMLDTSWEDPAVFTGEYAFDDLKKTFIKKDQTTVQYWVFEQGKIVDYVPKDDIVFGNSKEYSDLNGVTAFRGNNYRDSASYGNRTVTEKKLEIVWSHDIGAIEAENSKWPGTGWTGQPLLVNWSKEVREIMNINDEQKNKDLVEVIYPTLDGNIYFLDIETGKPTRDKIEVGFPMKGTGMIDPRGYPLLFAGIDRKSVV